MYTDAPERLRAPAPWSAGPWVVPAPERPFGADELGPAVHVWVADQPRFSRLRALARVVLSPAALVAIAVLRAATALTLPVAWLCLLTGRPLPATLRELYGWRLGVVARLRAFAWLATEGTDATSVAAPPAAAERYPAGRAWAWPLRLGLQAIERYFAWWMGLVMILAAIVCALVLGRVPAGVRRLQRATLRWLAEGDAFALLLTPRRPHLPEPEVYRRGAPADGPSGRRIAFPALAALWAVLGAIVASIGAGIPLIFVAILAGSDALDSAWVELAGGAVQSLAFVAVALAIARLYGPLRARDFGLDELTPLRSLGWTLLIAVAFFTFVAASLAPLAPLLSIVDAATTDDVALFAFAVLVIAVLAPVGEEIFFRGMLFSALRRWKGAWVAAFISAFLFSAAHLDFSPVLFIDRFVIGFVFAMAYAKTGRLMPCILAHATNNAIVLGLERGWDWQIAPLVAVCLLACFACVAPFRERGGGPLPEAAR